MTFQRLDRSEKVLYNETMYIPIDPGREYNPMEVVEHGWIPNNNDKPDYHFVLKLIKLGRLKAKNVGLGKGKYFKILGQDIIEYRRNRYGNTDTDTNTGSEVTDESQQEVLPQDQG